MSKSVSAVVFGCCLALFGASGHAQTVEQFTPWSVGDKVSYAWRLGAKENRLEQEVTVSDAARVALTERIPQREFTMEVDARTMDVLSGLCLANGQQCQFEPGIHVLDLPLTKGKKWNNEFTVKGETFSARIKQERQVEKTERIRTAAGEFDTLRIQVKSRIQGSDKSGGSFAGNESLTEWWSFTPSGKALMVKFDYRNSFGEKAIREVSAIHLQ